MTKKKQILIVALGSVALLIGLLASLWIFAVYVPQDSQTTRSIVVQIAPGASVVQIAETLKEQDVVSSALIFTIYARLSGQGNKLIPGTYALRGSMNIPQIVDYIASGRVAARKITVPEGLTVQKIADLWEQAGFGGEKEFLQAARLDYPGYEFLPGRSTEVIYTVEGYLYPATYQVSVNATAQEFIEQMLEAFRKQAWPTISQNNTVSLKPDEVVTLASIVELEARDATNRKKISGVFINRLNAGMPLQSDVTIKYPESGPVRGSDVYVPSAYNTYTIKALPPGPVCSPGIEAINAALNPTKTDDLYFLAAPDGTVYYARTLVDHNKNIQRYLK